MKAVEIEVPHERERTLIIDEKGLVSTSDSSSFMYLVSRERGKDMSKKITIIKVMENKIIPARVKYMESNFQS